MTERTTVLVIDPDPDVRALSHACLEVEGHDVVTAPDAQHAGDRLRGRRADVILVAAASPDPGAVTPAVHGLPAAPPAPIVVLLDPSSGGAPTSPPAGAPASPAAATASATGSRADTPRGGAIEDPGVWAEGVVEVVAKPLTPLLLVQVVEDVVATSSQDAQTRRRLAARLPAPEA